MMSSVYSYILSQWVGIVLGLVIAWHLPMPPIFATFWAWLWTKFASMFTAVSATPATPVANTAPTANTA